MVSQQSDIRFPIPVIAVGICNQPCMVSQQPKAEIFAGSIWIALLPLGLAAGIVPFRRSVALATVFAPTDRRAIEVRGRRLVRSDMPGRMGKVIVVPRGLGRHGTVAKREERVAVGTEERMGHKETV